MIKKLLRLSKSCKKTKICWKEMKLRDKGREQTVNLLVREVLLSTSLKLNAK